MQMSFPYLILRGRTFYYRRRIPTDVRQFYPGDFIVKSLKTRDRKLGMVAGEIADAACIREWAALRDPETTLLSQGRLGLRPRLDNTALTNAGREAGMLWGL